MPKEHLRREMQETKAGGQESVSIMGMGGREKPAKETNGKASRDSVRLTRSGGGGA